MKPSENKNFKISKGAGYLIGFSLMLAVAVTIFILSNNFIVSVSASVPMGITLGVSIEEKLQKRNSLKSAKNSLAMVGLISIGIIVFLSIFLLVKTY